MPDMAIQPFPDAKPYVKDEGECIIKRNTIPDILQDPLVLDTIIMLNKWLRFKVLPISCGFEELPYHYDSCLNIAITVYETWKAEKK